MPDSGDKIWRHATIFRAKQSGRRNPARQAQGKPGRECHLVPEQALDPNGGIGLVRNGAFIIAECGSFEEVRAGLTVQRDQPLTAKYQPAGAYVFNPDFEVITFVMKTHIPRNSVGLETGIAASNG